MSRHALAIARPVRTTPTPRLIPRESRARHAPHLSGRGVTDLGRAATVLTAEKRSRMPMTIFDAGRPRTSHHGVALGTWERNGYDFYAAVWDAAERRVEAVVCATTRWWAAGPHPGSAVGTNQARAVPRDL